MSKNKATAITGNSVAKAILAMSLVFLPDSLSAQDTLPTYRHLAEQDRLISGRLDLPGMLEIEFEIIDSTVLIIDPGSDPNYQIGVVLFERNSGGSAKVSAKLGLVSKTGAEGYMSVGSRQEIEIGTWTPLQQLAHPSGEAAVIAPFQRILEGRIVFDSLLDIELSIQLREGEGSFMTQVQSAQHWKRSERSVCCVRCQEVYICAASVRTACGTCTSWATENLDH